jgi:biopolymer transport protein ExbB
MRVGIENRHHASDTIKETILDAANLEIPQMEKHLPALSTVTHIAPLLGLLGTVTGNISAFGVLGKLGSVGDPALLAKGISEALLTTAAGLIVAIPAIIFYNYLVNKVNHTIIRLENRVNELVLLLETHREEKVEPVEEVSPPQTFDRGFHSSDGGGLNGGG